MCPAQWPQRSDAGEAWSCGLSVSSQALYMYHWATTLPQTHLYFEAWFKLTESQVFV